MNQKMLTKIENALEAGQTVKLLCAHAQWDAQRLWEYNTYEMKKSGVAVDAYRLGLYGFHRNSVKEMLNFITESQMIFLGIK